MRSMLDSLASGMVARESLESRLSAQEDAHADTSTHSASLVDDIASLETQTTFEFASVADAQGALSQEITHVSNGLGDATEDLSKMWDRHEDLTGTVRNQGVSLAEMAADKADRTFVRVPTAPTLRVSTWDQAALFYMDLPCLATIAIDKCQSQAHPAPTAHRPPPTTRCKARSKPCRMSSTRRTPKFAPSNWS